MTVALLSCRRARKLSLPSAPPGDSLFFGIFGALQHLDAFRSQLIQRGDLMRVALRLVVCNPPEPRQRLAALRWQQWVGGWNALVGACESRRAMGG